MSGRADLRPRVGRGPPEPSSAAETMPLAEPLLGQPAATAVLSAPDDGRVRRSSAGNVAADPSQATAATLRAVDPVATSAWHVDVDVDGSPAASPSPSPSAAAAAAAPRAAAAGSAFSRRPQTPALKPGGRIGQDDRCTQAVTALAMLIAVALCTLLGTLFADSSDSGLAGAAVGLIGGGVCGALIGLCYRWHDASSPV